MTERPPILFWPTQTSTQTSQSELRWLLRFCIRSEKSAAPGTLPPRPRPPGCKELFGSLPQLLKTQHKPALSRQLDHLRGMGRTPQPLLQVRTFFSMGYKANQRRHEAGSTTLQIFCVEMNQKISKSAENSSQNRQTFLK